MSLSKQLLILISLIFLIVFSVSFVISIGNIRNYLQVESEIHVQDTATSLGLSLSPHMDNEQDPILQTMMNAIFDMGYYKEMRLVNVDGQELVKLTNPVQMEGVPQWLISLLPMKTATAVSEISSGWNISGTLYVTGNPAYAYMKLYQQGKETLLYSLIIFIAAFALLMLVLRLTLKPLVAIQSQANQISAGNFITLAKLPWTTEVRNVAQSMNSMSKKIGDTITRLNARMDTLGDSLKRDPLTRLFNQASFDVDMKAALSSSSHGYVVYIKFDNLSSIAKDHGNQTVDNLLQQFAKILNSADSNSTAYRLYGSEFALITQHADVEAISNFTETLKQSITTLAQSYDIDDMVHAGIIGFNRSSDYERLMPALIEAYEQARLIGHNAFFVKQDSLSSRSDQEWKQIISNTIGNNSPTITFTSEAFNYQSLPAEKVMEEVFTHVTDEEGNPLSIGTFFSMAQEFGQAEALDRCIINKVISLMEQTAHPHPVTINLSMVSVASAEFQQWLKARLEQIRISPKLLTFSVTAYTAAKDLPTFAHFSSFVRHLGAAVMLKRYSADLIDMDVLKDLHIDYIRLARDLTHNIESNANKPDFLEIIQQVAGFLDIKVIAESVTDDNDFEFVKKLGLYGISR